MGYELIEGYDGYNDNYSRSLLFNYAASFMYEGDAPLAERRAQALSLDRSITAGPFRISLERLFQAFPSALSWR